MTDLQHREADLESGVERRYVELRFDGERTISGVAMRYGDTAKLPWGTSERFEPGAFGDVQGLDIILNKQHDRTLPLARTGGGGLKLTDSATDLQIKADLPETRDGDDTLALVRSKVLRGFSIEFIPIEWSEDRTNDVMTITRADLRNVAVVDRPAYPKATVNPRAEDDMTPDEITALATKAVEEALKKRDDAATAKNDAETLTKTVTEAVTASIEDVIERQIDEALEARGENPFKKKAKAKKKADGDDDDDEGQMAKKADGDDDDEGKMAKKAETDEEIEARVQARAELISMLTPMLPEGTETRGQSNHALLVLAVGDTVTEADKRSEDYLLAKVEGLIEARKRADEARPGTPTSGNPAPAAGRPNILRMAERRGMRKAGDSR